MYYIWLNSIEQFQIISKVHDFNCGGNIPSSSGTISSPFVSRSGKALPNVVTRSTSCFVLVSSLKTCQSNLTSKQKSCT